MIRRDIIADFNKGLAVNISLKLFVKRKFLYVGSFDYFNVISFGSRRNNHVVINKEMLGLLYVKSFT